jgi:large conductance mechanosensitive channel
MARETIKNAAKSAKERASAAKAKAIALKKKQPKIVKEFSDFINRGNVVDLAVGVIIGGAFGKIVTSLVNNIIMPLVGVIIGGLDFSNLYVTLPRWIGEGEGAVLQYGIFIQNVVDFLIVAFCVFLFVKLINKISLKKAEEEAAEAVEKGPTDNEKIIALLESIDKKLKK